MCELEINTVPKIKTDPFKSAMLILMQVDMWLSFYNNNFTHKI